MDSKPKTDPDQRLSLEAIKAASTKELLSGLPTVIKCELYEEAAMIKAELERRKVPFPKT